MQYKGTMSELQNITLEIKYQLSTYANSELCFPATTIILYSQYQGICERNYRH
jgi:hypothetical protein